MYAQRSNAPVNAPVDEKRQAELAWDALVKTKGGREKLRSISNILFDLYDSVPNVPSKSELHVLPDKIWDCVVFSMKKGVKPEPMAYMSDASKPIQYWATRTGVTESSRTTPNSWYALERVIYLLETQIDKPTPLRVYCEKKGKKVFDVIETKFKEYSVDYKYEPEEMLTREIVIRLADGFLFRTYKFFDYRELDGIMMPQRENMRQGDDKDNRTWPVGFAFNVDYDPDLFTRPLIATTPDGWKRKPSEK